MLLAGGLGTRLRPLTNTIPKCLVPINGRPLLAYWFDALQHAGITSVLINLHYLEHRVRSFIESRADKSAIHTVYEPELLGTAGTLRNNSDFLGSKPVMVIHADNLCLSDLKLFVEAHRNRSSGTEITMMTFNADDPKRCGVVELNDRNIVTAFHEKVANPPGNIANAAVYIFESTVIEYICLQEKSYLDLSTDVLPHYVDRIFTWPANKFHIDIGNLANLKKANSFFD